MTTTIRIPVEAMTDETFAPFGELWDARDRPADRRLLLPTGYAYQGRTTVSTIWQPHAGVGFNELERHFGVTQGFVQLAGAPAVVCVAAPSATEAPADVPDPADVRAFRIDPGKGFAFGRGTWHSLNRFVLEPPGATFLILNSDPNPTQMMNYETGDITVYTDLGVDRSPARSRHEHHVGIVFEIAP